MFLHPSQISMSVKTSLWTTVVREQCVLIWREIMSACVLQAIVAVGSVMVSQAAPKQAREVWSYISLPSCRLQLSRWRLQISQLQQQKLCCHYCCEHKPDRDMYCYHGKCSHCGHFKLQLAREWHCWRACGSMWRQCLSQRVWWQVGPSGSKSHLQPVERCC